MERVINFGIALLIVIPLFFSIYASKEVNEPTIANETVKDNCAKGKAKLCDFAIEYAARVNMQISRLSNSESMLLTRVVAKDDTLEFYLKYDSYWVLNNLEVHNQTMDELKLNMVKNAIKTECNPFGTMSSFIKSGGLVRDIASLSTGEILMDLNVDNRTCENYSDVN